MLPLCVCVCFIVREGESCTHWHGLAAVQGADCRLSLGVCGELDKGATWKRGGAHHAHSTRIHTANAFNRAGLKAHGVLIKDAELYLMAQKSLCSERLASHSRLLHSGH